MSMEELDELIANVDVAVTKIDDLIIVNPARIMKDRNDIFSERKLDRFMNPQEDTKCGAVRGLVFSTSKRRAVARSLPTEILRVGKSIDKLEENEVAYESIDGIMLRIFRDNSRTYFSTNRNLSAESSKWGASDTLRECFVAAAGFKPEDLFTDESSICYVFMITGSNFQYVTHKELPERCMVFYLGYFDLADDESYGTMTAGHVMAMTCHHLKVLDVDQINEELSSYGEELDGISGERVHVWKLKNLEESRWHLNNVADVLCIQSPGYTWRDAILSGETSVKSRLWHISTLCLPKTPLATFNAYFPHFRLGNAKGIIDIMINGNRMEFVKYLDHDSPPDGYETRKYRIFMSLTAIFPRYRLIQLLNAFESMEDEFNGLASWILALKSRKVTAFKPPLKLKEFLNTLRSKDIVSVRSKLSTMSGVDLHQMVRCRATTDRMSQYNQNDRPPI